MISTIRGFAMRPMTRPQGRTPAPEPAARDALRKFVLPMFEEALSWQGLSEALRTRGYTMVLREDRLAVLDRKGALVCTAEDLGASLPTLSKRLGQPRIATQGWDPKPGRGITLRG